MRLVPEPYVTRDRSRVSHYRLEGVLRGDEHACGLTLVTGASGFVGRSVCAHLVSRGERVRALVRGSWEQPCVEVAETADLFDRTAVRRALDGVDAVVHLAARAHVGRETSSSPMDAFRRTNVDGTRVLLEEATEAGVRTFAMASSVKAVGEVAANGQRFTEETVPHPTDPYGVSKWEAERVVSQFALRTGLRAVILRLPLVYGPGVGANMLRLLRLVDRGLPLPFGGIANRRSMIYVENVAAAFSHALRNAAACGTFFVSDGIDLSTPDWIRAIADALGRPARLIPVPESLLRGIGKIGSALRAPIDTADLERLVGSLVVDPSAFTRRVGFVPPVTVEEGVRRMAEWYRSQTPAVA